MAALIPLFSHEYTVHFPKHLSAIPFHEYTKSFKFSSEHFVSFEIPG